MHQKMRLDTGPKNIFMVKPSKVGLCGQSEMWFVPMFQGTDLSKSDPFPQYHLQSLWQNLLKLTTFLHVCSLTLKQSKKKQAIEADGSKLNKTYEIPSLLVNPFYIHYFWLKLGQWISITHPFDQ